MPHQLSVGYLGGDVQELESFLVILAKTVCLKLHHLGYKNPRFYYIPLSNHGLSLSYLICSGNPLYIPSCNVKWLKSGKILGKIFGTQKPTYMRLLKSKTCCSF